MDWNDEAIIRLRDLWTEGHSTAEIGRRLGISKNAVVGKAHRLNLTARPSPIRRDGGAGEVRPAAPRRITGPTLPSMAAPAGPAPSGGMSPQARALDLPVSLARPAATEATKPMPRPAPVRAVEARPMRSAACCWPLGEPGTPGFRFCDAEATQGKPYCASHASVAYVRVRDRREEAA